MKRIVMTFGMAVLASQAACDTGPTALPETALEPASALADQVEGHSHGLVWKEHWHMQAPVDGEHWVPCANNGAGEFVQFEGTILFNEQNVVTSNRYTYALRITPQNLTGYGTETGHVYRDVGGVTEHYAGGSEGGTMIKVDETYRMITRDGDDFFYRFRARVQYSPDGEPIVDWTDTSIECR